MSMKLKLDKNVIPPYGKSSFPLIWERDQTVSIAAFKFLMVSTVALGLAWMLYGQVAFSLLVSTLGLNGDWDEIHGIRGGFQQKAVILLMETIGFQSVTAVYRIFGVSIGLGAFLIILDWIVSLSVEEIWPHSWDISNTICYNEMFMEPSRNGRLLRRPGNTLSNIPYLTTSLFILSSKDIDYSDIMFGFIILLLFFFSFIWHASNATWAHYCDLWSMDSSIIYLILRSGCDFVLFLFGNDEYGNKTNNNDYYRRNNWFCCVIYGIFLFYTANFYYRLYQHQLLHGSFPISTRARLSGKSNFFGYGHRDILIRDVCIFAALPIIFQILPIICSMYPRSKAGSIMALNLVYRTLSIGWSYRLFERWALDGCLPMNFILLQHQKLTKKKGSSLVSSSIQVCLTAILSPTAILHFFTGFTLLAGYMHSRSMNR